MKTNTKNIVVRLLLLLMVFLMTGVVAVNASVHISAEEIVSLSDDDTIHVRHDNTVGAIVKKVRELPHDGFVFYKEASYKNKPSITAPYNAGELKNEDLKNALNATKVLRFLAGIPYEGIIIDETETLTAQHKSVLMAAAGYGHYPVKPADMSDEFYETANMYSAECIAWTSWEAPLSSRVLAWVADDGSNNIESAGHRMIFFNPGAERFGFGYVYDNINDCGLYTAHVDYQFNSIDSYVAWPNSGAFPIQYFIGESDLDYESPHPWSITLGGKYDIPDRDKIRLKLTRKSDGKVWIFNKNTPQLGLNNCPDNSMHLSVDGENIIFRPDVTSLKTIKDGETFSVELTGINYTDGGSAVLEYDINFFDIEKVMSKPCVTINVTRNNAPVEGARVVLGTQQIVTGTDGTATFLVDKNKTYSYTVSKNSFTTEQGKITVASADMTQDVVLISNKMFATVRKLGVNTSIKAFLISDAEPEGYVIFALYKDDKIISSRICSAKEEITTGFAEKGEYVRIFWLQSMESICPATYCTGKLYL